MVRVERRGRKKRTPRRHYHMNSADKTQLLALRHAGLTFRDIGKRMKLNSGNLCRVYNNKISTKSFNCTRGSGWKRKTTERDDALIVREVRRNRMVSGPQLKTLLPSVKVSERTFRRRINCCSDFQSQWVTRKPFVSKHNRIRRLKWARAHLN